jgi:trimeric autotransporter adhesin
VVRAGQHPKRSRAARAVTAG